MTPPWWLTVPAQLPPVATAGTMGTRMAMPLVSAVRAGTSGLWATGQEMLMLMTRQVRRGRRWVRRRTLLVRAQREHRPFVIISCPVDRQDAFKCVLTVCNTLQLRLCAADRAKMIHEQIADRQRKEAE